MLTKAEALGYLKDVLLIQNVAMDSGTERLETLNEVILRQHDIPFQSFSLLQNPPEQRRRPTVEEIKHAVFTKSGGLCYTLNTFLFCLLRAIGFDAYLNIGHVVHGKPNNHIIVLVRNVVQEGDMYLAEEGVCNPTFKAVNLDFVNESPVFRELNLVYKYVKEGKLIKRLHGREYDMQYTGNNDFQVFYEFEINPTTDIAAFDDYFDYLYSNVDALHFHNLFLATRFTKSQKTAIVNSKLTIVNQGGEIFKTDLEDEESVVSATKMYFPEYDENMVRKALAIWKASGNELMK